ncbi:hypothetical protein [Pseudoduganella armeniaca]|uniref:Uncharacterized protein n=1 Tax=Pseudoduganella armeniaca TaxID=2072590 RepID=A0A2R4CBE4_9BURK|nr:hypothetical protein [Pseudoduganella armeniaca]AVR96964.1 hypothetical protein C9I28_15860 [Pseudoduganella armeniaca]
MLIERFDSRAASAGVMDLLERARREVDPREPRSLMALAAPLHALAGERSLLQRCIHHGLANWGSGPTHFYSSQSCHVASAGPFAIRINLWPLLPADPRRRAILADVLSYFDYHDHNFSFITANYAGPGYETDLYSYDAACVTGYPGEAVRLAYQGRHRLDDATVLLYEAGRDVHRQLPPAAPSASLNLMLTPPDAGLTNQFYFDVERGIIRDYVGSWSHKRVDALGFARHWHDEHTPALLRQIAESHPCSRTRVAAGHALTACAGRAALSAACRARMLRDPLARALWQGNATIYSTTEEEAS